MAILVGNFILELYELGVSVHITQVGAGKFLTTAGGVDGGLIKGILHSLTEMLVVQSSVGIDLLLLGLGGSHGAALKSEGAAVDVQTAKVGGAGGVGNVGVLIEVTVSLGLVEQTGGNGKGDTGIGTGDCIVVQSVGVLAIIKYPLNAVKGYLVSAIVFLVLYDIDLGILLQLLEQEGTAVNLGSDVLRLTEGVGVGICGSSSILLYAIDAAVRLIEGVADGQEAGVGKHGHEVGDRLLKSDLKGVIINSLVADFVPAAAVGIVVGAADNNAVDQPLKTGLSIKHVMETGDKVVSGNFSILGAFRGIPVHALADVEGIGLGAIIIYPGLPALRQGGLHVAKIIVLDKTINAVDGDLGIGLGRGVQPVDGYRSGLEGGGVILLEGVALAGQYGSGIIGGSSGKSSFPSSYQLGALFLGDELVTDDHALQTVVVVAPLYIGDSPVRHAADGVSTALGGVRDHDGRLKQMGLSLGIEHKALVIGGGSLSGGHKLFVLAKSSLILLLIVAADVFYVNRRVRSDRLARSDRRIDGCRGLHIDVGSVGVAVTGYHGKNHSRSHKQRDEFLHCFSSF